MRADDDVPSARLDAKGRRCFSRAAAGLLRRDPAAAPARAIGRQIDLVEATDGDDAGTGDPHRAQRPGCRLCAGLQPGRRIWFVAPFELPALLLSAGARLCSRLRLAVGLAFGADAPGGAVDYVVHGKMIGGFGLVAWPAHYGDSGVITFIVNHNAIVYQKNLGPESAALAEAMTLYDPDPSWQKSRLSRCSRPSRNGWTPRREAGELSLSRRL
jgi:Protein of unknown function (DUF2950)